MESCYHLRLALVLGTLDRLLVVLLGLDGMHLLGHTMYLRYFSWIEYAVRNSTISPRQTRGPIFVHVLERVSWQSSKWKRGNLPPNSLND